jgi:hypothetical protein
VPPTVRADPADGNYVVKKGHRVELRCSASGNPHPSIRWSRKVSVNNRWKVNIVRRKKDSNILSRKVSIRLRRQVSAYMRRRVEAD